MGCRMKVEQDDNGEIHVSGNACKRGERYGKLEFSHPERTVTSSMRVIGGDYPLVSIKTADNVPKDCIDDVLKAINSKAVTAPIMVGDVLIPNVAGTGINVVATRKISALT